MNTIITIQSGSAVRRFEVADINTVYTIIGMLTINGVNPITDTPSTPSQPVADTPSTPTPSTPKAKGKGKRNLATLEKAAKAGVTYKVSNKAKGKVSVTDNDGNICNPAVLAGIKAYFTEKGYELKWNKDVQSWFINKDGKVVTGKNLETLFTDAPKSISLDYIKAKYTEWGYTVK